MSQKMRKMEIDGVEITTNFSTCYAYPMGDGNDKKTYRYAGHVIGGKADLEHFVHRGYRTIRFENVTTMVRGFHQTIAYVK